MGMEKACKRSLVIISRDSEREQELEKSTRHIAPPSANITVGRNGAKTIDENSPLERGCFDSATKRIVTKRAAAVEAAIEVATDTR